MNFKKIKQQLFKGIVAVAMLLACTSIAHAQYATHPRFNVLAFFSTEVEGDHVAFCFDAIKYFQELTSGQGFILDTTSNLTDYNYEKLKNYHLVIMFSDYPQDASQRAAFQKYMENGGGWMGFHSAGYNDRNTNWPWMLDFLGGGFFYRNSWPPIPAKLVIDDPKHPVTKALPQSYISPENEWYQWDPSPRERKNIKVLVSLSPDNYPLGIKDIVTDGDFPVVWTNTDYRMIYLNFGHGKKIFTDATQNKLIIEAMRWVLATDKKNVFE